MGNILHLVNSLIRQPVTSLGISGLSLLLLVIVLLSVPGPVKSMYWFSLDSPTGEGDRLMAGVMGWCWAGVSPGTAIPYPASALIRLR